MNGRSVKALLIAGIVGAIIGGFFGYLSGGPIESFPSSRHMTLPIGAMSGFLSCLIMSSIALKIMKGKNWKTAFLLGPLFGGLAGAISGFITDIIALPPGIKSGIIGSIVGGFIGVIAGFILGPILAKIAEQTS